METLFRQELDGTGWTSTYREKFRVGSMENNK